MSHDPSKIAVVIPYFQCEAGLLRQCVQSVLATKGGVDTRILVVDDTSPRPAEDEIGDLAAEPALRITIIRQGNAGPAAARNRGLDHVSKDTPFVAFLDSDDSWSAPFLPDAVSVLAQGFDLFIGNTRRGGIERSGLEWEKDSKRNLDPKQHRLIDAQRDIYQFQGDFFDLLVHRTNIISASAMAYRFDRFPSLRFRTELFQGEDRLFKLALGQKLDKVAFSPKVYADEGEGVNIFDKAGWGTEGSLRLVANYISLSKIILGEIELNPNQQTHIRRCLTGSRQSFAASLLHLLRHRKPVGWRQVRATIRDDPAIAALLLPEIIRLAGRRLLTRKRDPDTQG